MNISFEISSMKTRKPTGVACYIGRLIDSICSQKNQEDNVFLYYKLSRIKNRKNFIHVKNSITKTYYNRIWPFLKYTDIFHGLDGYVPNWNNTKKVITIHDIASMKLKDQSISSESFRKKKELTYKEVLKYVDSVITVSESTKNDVIEDFNFRPDKIFVTHLGIGEEYYTRDPESVDLTLSKYAINKNYLLFIGDLSIRKNTERMIQAYERSKSCKDVEFVFSGGVSYGGEKSLEQIKALGLENRVKILNYVDSLDLPALYTGASGLVFPTLYEGFGLPILEAMACGTPVLASNVGSAPEISGELSILVNPYDVDEIAQGIDLLLERPSECMDDYIRHAKQFTWDKCAKKTLDVYEILQQSQ